MTELEIEYFSTHVNPEYRYAPDVEIYCEREYIMEDMRQRIESHLWGLSVSDSPRITGERGLKEFDDIREVVRRAMFELGYPSRLIDEMIDHVNFLQSTDYWRADDAK